MTITKERAAELDAQQPEATKQGGLPDVGVCVQCLAAYNQGEHHWVWVDLVEMANQGETLTECIQWMLASSPAAFAEEWMFSDSSGLPGYLQGEHVATVSVEAYALACERVDDQYREAFRLLCDYLGETVDADRFDEMFLGEQDPEDYVADYYDETNEIPDHLLPYIDWEAIARDWRLNGDLIVVDGYLFNGNA